MTRFVRFSLITVGLSILLIPFQNCAVYKSAGKKFLEKNAETYLETGEAAATVPARTGTQSANDPVQKNCLPYLTAAEASTVFSRTTEAKLFFDPYQDALTCMVSTQSETLDETETAVCSISSANVGHLRLSPPQDVLPDPYESTDSEVKGFGLMQLNKDSSSVKITFVGARTGAVEGVSCSFSFATRPKLERDLTLALERASHLVHVMAERIQ